MRSMARWFLLTVLALDTAFAVLFFAGGIPTIGAETGPSVTEPESTGEEQPSVWTREALELLGRQLEERTADLERREAELQELERAEEVLERAGVTTEPPPSPAGRPAASEPPSPAHRDAFKRLQRAYENMEPTMAAQALAKLADRDKEAVMQLLLGWQPRTSGAILDALTQSDPALAADLSYEIWKLGGNDEP